MSSAFFESVYALVRRVPAGKVVTYGQVARALGSPRAARTVGWAMQACPQDVPWQRVVNSRGEVSARAHVLHERLQRELLEDEGVTFDLLGRIDLRAHQWDGY